MRVLSFCQGFFRSEHIQLALVSGVSIVSLAYVSKHVLPQPMDSIYLTVPALMVAAAEGMIGSKQRAKRKARKTAWYMEAHCWVIAIACVTILIIVRHLI